MNLTATSTGEQTEKRPFALPSLTSAQLLVWLQAMGLLLLFLLLFGYVQFGTAGLVGNDGYYHIKLSYLMREQGTLRLDFPWLPLTILSPDGFYDHHLLYHVYLALFAPLDPALDGGQALVNGAKYASILLPALAFLAVWWLLRGQKVPAASLWAVGLFALSEPFLYRLSMARAQSASLLVLVLALHWLLKGRYRLLLPLGFVYVWLYNAFPLLLLVTAVYVTATWLTERRLAWQPVAYAAAGIALGILVNPYFPQNVAFIISHILPKVGELTTSVGNEWYPYQTWTLAENSGYALLAFLLGVLALGWHDKRIDRPTLVALGLAVLFGAMLFKSRRFIEYYPAFALLFLAFSLRPLWREWVAEIRYGRYLLPLALVLLLAYPLVDTLVQGRTAVAKAAPADQYAQAGLWLAANVPADELIFQTDWDDFPRLFFYDSRHRYLVGLDPTYLELVDPDLFAEWVEITQGRVTPLAETIETRFGSRYVFSDLDHRAFLRQAEADSRMQELYRDEYAVIFEILP
jgi:intracellular septation protein A